MAVKSLGTFLGSVLALFIRLFVCCLFVFVGYFLRQGLIG